MTEFDETRGDVAVDAFGEAGATRVVRIVADTRAFRRELDDAERAGRRVSTALFGAFEQLAFKGKSLNDVVRSLALNVSQITLKAAFAPLERGLSSAIGGLLSGGLAGGLGFAKGGVLSAGTAVPFAKGGVVSSPIAFPLAGGRTGLMGERGAEAILPLTRGRD
ncbi:MAG: phage tail tape measure protein, partial [Hyphomicrobium sp.]